MKAVGPMEKAIEFFAGQQSHVLMFIALLVAGLGVPFPEDIVLLAGGILIQRNAASLWGTVTVCIAGVLFGDVLLFLQARRLGPAIYRRRFIRSVLTEERRRRLEVLFERWGGLVVFVARHLAGLRAPTFATAAIHGMPLWKFVAFDSLGLAVSLPLVMWIGYRFADSIDQAQKHVARAEHYLLLAVVGVIVLMAIVHMIRLGRHRRSQGSAGANHDDTSAKP